MNDVATPASQTHFAFGMDVPLPGELFVSKGVVLHIHGDYVSVPQKVMPARVPLLRNPGAPPEKRAAVERFARLETSIGAASREKIAAKRAHRPTLNLEGMFLWATAGTRPRDCAFRYKGRQLTRQRIERPGQRLLNALVPITPRHTGLQAPIAAGASARDGGLVERPPFRRWSLKQPSSISTSCRASTLAFR